MGLNWQELVALLARLVPSTHTLEMMACSLLKKPLLLGSVSPEVIGDLV